ncbi:hypothetical protein HNP86_001124 [Methanococcus maripaludis]|uniref:ATP/GTP-binding site motif A (P-loop) n=1 Tax=Methanococcus maripaludis TaxID=39152 RepID=A0A7J9S219_METMI|nr:ATP-binding protein [Methanococcus maripaludis]MBA2850993.1 hypothetical protein [Methanococcus maripaludis]MBB6067730.1 hypothetical protein [Methanococcus maripaludis]
MAGNISDEDIQQNILKHLYKINSRDVDAFLSCEIFKEELSLDRADLYRNIDTLKQKGFIKMGNNPELIGYSIRLSEKGMDTFENPKFTREEIEKAYKTFKIYAEEVTNASYDTYTKSLAAFLNYCKNNEVLEFVIFKFNLIERDFEKWYDNFLNSKMHAHTLPLDEDEKISIIYKFLNEINSGKIKISEFVKSAYKISGKTEKTINKFNQSIFLHFVKGIDIRLKKLMSKIESVPEKPQTDEKEVAKTEELPKVSKIEVIDSDSVTSKRRLENFEKDNKVVIYPSEVIDGDALSRKLSKNSYNMDNLENALLKLSEELRNDNKSVAAISAVFLLSKNIDSSDLMETQKLLNEAVSAEPCLKDKFKDIAMASSIEVANTGIIKGILALF